MELDITPAAERFIRLMLMADGGPESGFRIAVSPGGCSGLSAEIEVVDMPEPGDTMIKRNGIKLFLPVQSRILLEGVTIDFADTPAQTGLVFHDPKAGPTCSSMGAPFETSA